METLWERTHLCAHLCAHNLGTRREEEEGSVEGDMEGHICKIAQWTLVEKHMWAEMR